MAIGTKGEGEKRPKTKMPKFNDKITLGLYTQCNKLLHLALAKINATFVQLHILYLNPLYQAIASLIICLFPSHSIEQDGIKKSLYC